MTLRISADLSDATDQQLDGDIASFRAAAGADLAAIEVNYAAVSREQRLALAAEKFTTQPSTPRALKALVESYGATLRLRTRAEMHSRTPS